MEGGVKKGWGEEGTARRKNFFFFRKKMKTRGKEETGDGDCRDRQATRTQENMRMALLHEGLQKVGVARLWAVRDKRKNGCLPCLSDQHGPGRGQR